MVMKYYNRIELGWTKVGLMPLGLESLSTDTTLCLYYDNCPYIVKIKKDQSENVSWLQH